MSIRPLGSNQINDYHQNISKSEDTKEKKHESVIDHFSREASSAFDSVGYTLKNFLIPVTRGAFENIGSALVGTLTGSVGGALAGAALAGVTGAVIGGPAGACIGLCASRIPAICSQIFP